MIVPGGADAARLRALVLAELKKAGLKHRTKKTVSKNVKEMKAVYGAPLSAVALRAVSCCGSNLSVPTVVVDLCSELRENVQVEGLFRKAGSASRQKEIKRVLECGGTVGATMAHPVDAASLLKLYLRTLPDPLISAEVQELLLRCRLAADSHHASDEHLRQLMHTLMLLPILHLHLLHYVMELLNTIALRHKENLMDATNLAIVMTPSIMPLPTTASTQRLEHHVALVKIFIENSKHIGNLTEELLSQLDGEEVNLDQARRKKRRSGSLNRVLNGLRKMVGGGERSAQTPARDRDYACTPIISKSAAKRKLDTQEGFSTNNKKQIKQNLPQKELTFTPKKMGTTERNKLRLSMMETPRARSAANLLCESSASSEDLLASPDHLFTSHRTIDLSDSKPDKDYVKIPKHEFEEIKSRVSAIESRLSKEWTDAPAPAPVQPLQHVQNVYERTLEDVAALNYSSSDQLARRLSRELNIRPSNQHKIIRSPSARKIGTIRRRSKENVTKLVRHKSWNVTAQLQSSGDADRFYPYVGLKRGRPNTMVTGLPEPKTKNRDEWATASPDASPTEDSRKVPRSHISRRQSARDSTKKPSTFVVEHQRVNVPEEYSAPYTRHKWKNAAAYFMERTGEGEAENISQSGRPSVNKLRSQNAGTVLAKAKLFESSTDRSSEKVSNTKMPHSGFARRPRISGPLVIKSTKSAAPPVLKVKPNSAHIIETSDYGQNSHRQNVDTGSSKNDCDVTPQQLPNSKRLKKVVTCTVPNPCRSPPSPVIKKPLSVKSPRSFHTAVCVSEPRRVATPLRAAHNTSPRRHSPRVKVQRSRR